MAPSRRRRVDGMARGAESTSSAKRAKLCKEKKRDALERERNELILGVANARAKAKELEERLVREAKEALAQRLPSVCADLEAENRDELMGKLPPELWEKILDENVDQNDLLALTMTCRFFREKQKDLGKKIETNVDPWRLLDVRKSGKTSSHTLGWFQWVCDNWYILPGFKWGSKRVKGAVYEADLLNYAAFQGSVEILRWLIEEKGCKLNPHRLVCGGLVCTQNTGWYVGLGGSVKVLEYLLERGYEFDVMACYGAARGGHLEALKYLRGLDPPCPWDEGTCAREAWGGTCSWAAQKGHLEVLKFARGQDPPCPWSRSECRAEAKHNGHQHIVDWIDQREDESDGEDWEYSDWEDW